MLKSLSRKGMLENKKILVIERERKDVNDRTFCFWAKPEESIVTNMNNLITRSWGGISQSTGVVESMFPYRYYYIKGLDLYEDAKSICQSLNVHWICAEVNEIDRNKYGSYVIINEQSLIHVRLNTLPYNFRKFIWIKASSVGSLSMMDNMGTMIP
jgi:lycopene beta-cyclase